MQLKYNLISGLFASLAASCGKYNTIKSYKFSKGGVWFRHRNINHGEDNIASRSGQDRCWFRIAGQICAPWSFYCPDDLGQYPHDSFLCPFDASQWGCQGNSLQLCSKLHRQHSIRLPSVRGNYYKQTNVRCLPNIGRFWADIDMSRVRCQSVG